MTNLLTKLIPSACMTVLSSPFTVIAIAWSIRMTMKGRALFGKNKQGGVASAGEGDHRTRPMVTCSHRTRCRLGGDLR